MTTFTGLGSITGMVAQKNYEIPQERMAGMPVGFRDPM